MKSLRNGFRSIYFMLPVVLLFACSGTQGKGEESEMPVFGSTDSWRSPTVHGNLVFGEKSSAEFKEGSFYHAWDFVLTGPAEVFLEIDPYDNYETDFDTVMYLYKREPGTTNWGSYIARNDDCDGNLWSRLDEHLGPGQYRIMIKGYKKSLRGRFNLKGSCDGPGCDTVEASTSKRARRPSRAQSRRARR